MVISHHCVSFHLSYFAFLFSKVCAGLTYQKAKGKSFYTIKLGFTIRFIKGARSHQWLSSEAFCGKIVVLCIFSYLHQFFQVHSGISQCNKGTHCVLNRAKGQLMLMCQFECFRDNDTTLYDTTLNVLLRIVYYSGCAHPTTLYCNTMNKNLKGRFQALSCQHQYTFPRCVYLPYYPAWLQRGVACWKDSACPAHPEPSKSGKRILFPREWAVTPAGSNLYQHLSPINPAVHQSGKICPSEQEIFQFIRHGRKDLRLQLQVRHTGLNINTDKLQPALLNTIRQVRKAKYNSNFVI